MRRRDSYPEATCWAVNAIHFDPLGLIEQGYRPCSDALDWLQRMAPMVTAPLDQDGFGAMSFFLDPGGPRLATWTPGRARPQDETGQPALEGALRSLSPGALQRLRGVARAPGLFSLTEAVGYFPLFGTRGAIADSPSVVIHTGVSPPVVMATLTRSLLQVSYSERTLWSRLAVHLAAGCRLAGRADDTEAEDVEAVVTPSGETVHAVGEARSATSRDALRDAVCSLDRARARRSGADPLTVLDTWRGLLLGRWTLVDHFESDGRRFILARRNSPSQTGSELVPERQRQVAFYASLGWSNKEIGYALGIAESTVATHLRRALGALGFRSRADLLNVASRLCPAVASFEREVSEEAHAGSDEMPGTNICAN